jgi:hypothetical protein
LPFKNALEPTTVDELLQILIRDSDVRFWRGSSDSSWKLDSGVVRRLRSEGEAITERSVRNFEQELLGRARHRGFDVRDGIRLSDFELLALLRHYGAATRLIDFTRSATVALWFAVYENPSIEGELVGIHTDFVGGYEGRAEDGAYEEVLKATERHEHAMTWEPRRTTARISAQHSQFLYARIEEHDYGTLWMPTDHAKGVLAIRISPALKAGARLFLRNVLDIGAESMYPDLPGFASTFGAYPIEEFHRW